MRSIRLIGCVSALVLVCVLMMPMTAGAALTNDYGQYYAGRDICETCHFDNYAATSHGEFAMVGADPADDFMWPAGRSSVGEMVDVDEIAFTLGAGTGLREYIAYNAPQAVSVQFKAVQGATRYDTAIAASQMGFTSASTVVIATGQSFPDALGGAALAGAVNGPILLTPSDAVPTTVLNEITRLGATKAYVLGGVGAVSAAAFDQIDGVVGTVERIAGANRYETASLVAAKVVSLLGTGYDGAVFVATGASFPDALAASPVAFAKDMPIVLANPAATTVALPAGTTDAVILGGTSAVLPVAETYLKTTLGTSNVTRLAGADRYATAGLVADYGASLGLSWDGVGIATGASFPDALSGGPLLGSKGTVVLLTPSTTLSSQAASRLTAHKAHIMTVHYLGGTAAVSTAVRSQVSALLPPMISGSADPFMMVEGLEWDPALPETWEIGADGIELGAYTCSGCHQLGVVRAGQAPTVGKFAGASAASINAWAADPNISVTDPTRYVGGSSIQCEVCHGYGENFAVGAHMGIFTGVKVVRGVDLTDSDICGQCHARNKSGSTLGYTPDQELLDFIEPYGFSDVPSEVDFLADPDAYRFYPSGHNKGLKHSYYSEWTLSAHSMRPKDPEGSLYGQAGISHYGSSRTGTCNNCHTGEGYLVRRDVGYMEDFEATDESVGYYGQECVVCHIPHRAGTENGMAVRSPEAGNNSICEDCHNWQFEVQGREAELGPDGRILDPDYTRSRPFSHPTREVYNGVGMYDIDEAGMFMPGVKCEECHMPATRSDFPDKTGLERDADRSWKRYSHRMFIMEPGDAEAWGLEPWGDSCSPCHAGQSQSELQTAIEEWQADALTAADDLLLAFNAAAATPATDTPDGAELLGRAWYNYKFYDNDGSAGAHNPEYIVDGLMKGEQLALSVNGYFESAVWADAGSFYFVAGNINNGDDSPAAGAMIVLKDGTDAVIGTTMSDANGNFSFRFVAEGDYTLTWERCSDPVADIDEPFTVPIP